MKQQLTGLVLSALLFSTFGHDLWNHHNRHLNKRQHLTGNNNRDKNHCTCPCPCSSTGSPTEGSGGTGTPEPTPDDNSPSPRDNSTNPTSTDEPTSDGGNTPGEGTSSPTPHGETSTPVDDTPNPKPGEGNPTPGRGESPTPGDEGSPTPGDGGSPTPGGGGSPTPGDGGSLTPGDGGSPTPGGEVTQPGDGSPTPTPGGDSNTTTGPVSSVNGSLSLQIFINASAEIVAIISEKVVFVLNVSNHTVAFFDGSSGAVIIFNYASREGYIVSSSSSVSWSSTREDWSAYWGSLDFYAVLVYVQRHGQRFTTGNVSAIIVEQIRISLTAFGVVVTDGQSALAIWYQISYSWSVVLTGSSGGILKLIGDVRGVAFRGTLLTVVSTFQGISAFFTRIRGSVTLFIQKHISIDIRVLLSASSSFEIFVYFVKISRQYHIDNKDLEAQFSNTFELIASFCANSTKGIDGVVTTIATLISVAQGRASIDVAIQALVLYYQNNNGSSTTEKLQTYFVQVRNELRALGFTQQAREIDLLIRGKYVVNKVNISVVYTYMIQTNYNPLHNIVQVLVAFQKVIRVEDSIFVLIMQLIYITAQENGKVIISILLNIQINYSGNLLIYIVRNSSLGSLSGNVYEILKRLIIFGQIIQSIEDGLGHCGSNASPKIFLPSKGRMIIELFKPETINNTVRSIVGLGSFRPWLTSLLKQSGDLNGGLSLGHKKPHDHDKHDRNHLSGEKEPHNLGTKHHDKHGKKHHGRHYQGSGSERQHFNQERHQHEQKNHIA